MADRGDEGFYRLGCEVGVPAMWVHALVWITNTHLLTLLFKVYIHTLYLYIIYIHTYIYIYIIYTYKYVYLCILTW
jgi:hypothetical protein